MDSSNRVCTKCVPRQRLSHQGPFGAFHCITRDGPCAVIVLLAQALYHTDLCIQVLLYGRVPPVLRQMSSHSMFLLLYCDDDDDDSLKVKREGQIFEMQGTTKLVPVRSR